METDLALNRGYTPIMTELPFEWVVHEAQALNAPVRATSQLARRRR